MSIQFMTGKLQGQERKTTLQAIQRQMKEAVIEAIRPLFTEFCEQEVTVKLGRGARSPRQVSTQAREIDWQCSHCGCRDAHQFTRDGHYRRSLETGWGHIQGRAACRCWNVNAVDTIYSPPPPSSTPIAPFPWT